MKGFSGVKGAKPHPDTAAGETGKSVPSGLRPKSTTLAQKFSVCIFRRIGGKGSLHGLIRMNGSIFQLGPQSGHQYFYLFCLPV